MPLISSRFTSEYLFLLVGENPLPNYVVTQLLLRPGGTAHLLHTGSTEKLKGPPAQTESSLLAERLKRLLEAKCAGIHVLCDSVPPANSRQIEDAVQPLLRRIKEPVGLNYTGGTKAMALHTYRLIAAQFPNAVFTYLAGNSMELHVDGQNAALQVADRIRVTLPEMAALHGYELINPGRQQPRLLPLASALVNVYLDESWADCWQDWLRQVPLSELPDLPPIQAALLEMGSPAPKELAASVGQAKLAQAIKWFNGGWLEELALAAVLQVRRHWPALDLCAGLELTPDRDAVRVRRERDPFELDIAVTIGYQLFVISCIASERKPKAKEHLLEAFVRARQLGGDEARVALVCLVGDPERLQREIERSWHGAGRVRVFGADHLPGLAQEFHNWFMQSRRQA